MLKKKLLTVACALGILACGACFLPPLPTPRPTAPPLPVQARWRQIHRIRVTATDVSDSHHLDGDDLAMKVANRINWTAGANGIRAFAGREPANEDAVLELKVEKESATQSTFTSTSSEDWWLFSIGVSVSLTDRNGRILWQDVEPALTHRIAFPWDPSRDRWRQGGLYESLPALLGDRVAHLALYQR